METGAQVIRCDVAIVGGGIAGVTCAERLAREARRQEKALRILLLEKEAEIGAGTSSGLEGWYHTGALYAGKDMQVLTNCLNALEDLYNWYFFDREFQGAVNGDREFQVPKNCNLLKLTEQNPIPRYDRDALDKNPGCWFLEEIGYLLPFEDNRRDGQPHRWTAEWKQTARQAKELIAQLFFKCDWTNSPFDCCQAPHICRDFTPPNNPNEDLPFRNVLNRNVQNNSAFNNELQEWEGRLSNIRDSMRKKDDVELDIMPSRDMVMNTGQILRDLVQAAHNQGVEFWMGCELDPELVRVSRVTNNIEQLIVRRKSNGEGVGEKLYHIRANQYVFALGFDFDEKDFLRRDLGIRVRVEKKQSVMVVASPTASPCSFARLDQHPDYQINRICHPREEGGFSIIADANAIDANADIREQATRASELLNKMDEIIPVGSETWLGWYSCLKTEFVTDAKTQRNYGYRVDPRLQEWLVHPVWAAAYNDEKKRKEVQETIKKWVVEFSPGSPLLGAWLTSDGKIRFQPSTDIRQDPSYPAVSIKEDGWALGRALHSALLQYVCAKNRMRDDPTPQDIDFKVEEDDLETARTTFDTIQQDMVERYKALFETRETVQPNYLCVIPGKFSFFPTLAHNVYSEMEARGVYYYARRLDESRSSSAPGSDPPPVAPHLADKILKNYSKKNEDKPNE